MSFRVIAGHGGGGGEAGEGEGGGTTVIADFPLPIGPNIKGHSYELEAPTRRKACCVGFASNNMGSLLHRYHQSGGTERPEFKRVFPDS